MSKANFNSNWQDPSSASKAAAKSLLAKKQIATFTDGLELVSGDKLESLDITYETFGSLAPEKNNAILIVHALTGDSHCAGKYAPEDKKAGWWDPLIGPGKAFDTNKYFIISSNTLGGCQGTTGPTSINPATSKRYNLSFPVITIRDMVNAQKKLIDFLDIDRLLCVAGGSMGGMVTLEWSVAYPEMVSSIIPVSTCAKLSPQGIAFSEVERQAIIRDPKWLSGNYPPEIPPGDGLAVARMIAHITYLSHDSMQIKFGRRKQRNSANAQMDFGERFEIENYLDYQGTRFVERFDANSYIYLTKAMDFYDLADGYPSLEDSVRRMKCKALFVSFSTDWLFSTRETEELVTSMREIDREVEFHEIESTYGHDAFLIEYPKYDYLLKRFIERVYINYNQA